MAKQLYRAAKTDPPTRVDFLSNAALETPLINDDPEVIPTYDGISPFTPWLVESSGKDEHQ